MSPDQAKCLKVLAKDSRPNGECCLHFKPIIEGTGLERRAVRRSVRALARKGMAEYVRGLWSEDGMPAGAGYCITRKGLEAAANLT